MMQFTMNDNWSKLISELMSDGVTQMEIAAACKCGQSTISDIYRQEIKQPAYNIGNALIEMHKKHCNSAKKVLA